jgi:hypothetical protein
MAAFEASYCLLYREKSGLAQSGLLSADMKKVLVRSTIRMAERHARNSPGNCRAAVEKLNALANGSRLRFRPLGGLPQVSS